MVGILGARQVGKTTLTRQLAARLPLGGDRGHGRGSQLGPRLTEDAFNQRLLHLRLARCIEAREEYFDEGGFDEDAVEIE